MRGEAAAPAVGESGYCQLQIGYSHVGSDGVALEAGTASEH